MWMAGVEEVADITGAESMTEEEDMEEVADMTGIEVVPWIKDMEDDAMKDGESRKMGLGKDDYKTKKVLIAELEALRKRVSEMERHERNLLQATGNFGEITDRSFSQTANMHEVVFVTFDRKLEFVNDRFTELFGVEPEEACSFDFDPITLVAPESRCLVLEQYREGLSGAFKTKQFNFTGLSKDGLKIPCETLLMFIPYKWGFSIQGKLRNIYESTRIDDSLQKRCNDLPFVFNTVPTGVLYADRYPLSVQANNTFSKSNRLPMK